MCECVSEAYVWMGRCEEVCRVLECVCVCVCPPPTAGVIKYIRLPQLTHFLPLHSTHPPTPKHSNKPCVTCPSIPALRGGREKKKRLRPNIGFDDSNVSSAPWVSGLFAAVVTGLKAKAGPLKGARLKFQGGARNDSRPGRKRVLLTSPDTSADPSSVSSLFVCVCVSTVCL